MGDEFVWLAKDAAPREDFDLPVFDAPMGMAGGTLIVLRWQVATDRRAAEFS